MTAQSIVHVVDDDAAFRKSTVRLLRACGYEVAEYGSAQEFLDAGPEPRSGCILLDVRMPDMSGLQLQGRLAELESILPIVFLTGHGDVPTSVQAIKAGAEDFLSKPVSKNDLVDAVTRALARYEKTHARRYQKDELQKLVASLTPREREVFLLVVKGKLNKQVGHELGTTERTVKAHRQKVMTKLRCHSLAELVRIGERLGVAAAAERDGDSA